MLSLIICTFISLMTRSWCFHTTFYINPDIIDLSWISSINILIFWKRNWLTSSSMRSISFLGLKIQLLRLIINHIVLYDFAYNFSYIRFERQSFKNCSNFVQFSIWHIIVPTSAWNSVLRLKHKSYWRIINDNNISHWST